MRDGYEDSPAAAREQGLRRLSRLTWRTTQLGALATVGFAIVFARTAPAPAASVQGPAPTVPATTIAAPTQPPVQHAATPRITTSTHPAPLPGTQQTTQGAQPKPTTAAPASSPSRTLKPPATAPAPAPSTSAPSPVPTVTSTSHGGG